MSIQRRSQYGLCVTTASALNGAAVSPICSVNNVHPSVALVYCGHTIRRIRPIATRSNSLESLNIRVSEDFSFVDIGYANLSEFGNRYKEAVRKCAFP